MARSNLTGTSFAAPVISGFIAMCAEAAGVSRRSYLTNKVYTRMSAVTSHQMNDNAASGRFLYPTYTVENPSSSSDPVVAQQYQRDSLAGAGIMNAESYYIWCKYDFSNESNDGEPNGEDRDEGFTDINLDGGEEVPPGAITGVPAGGSGSHVDPDGNIIEQGLRDNSISDQYRFKELNSYGSVEEGHRIRFVAAYKACEDAESLSGLNPDPIPSPQSLPGVPSADIDIFLCDWADRNNPVCETYSESANDSVEGFDVRLTRDYDDLKVYAVWPEGSVNCEGTANLRMFWASNHYRY